MKRRANYNAGKGKGGSYTQDVSGKNPEQPGDGWAARLVNDPLELLCFTVFCIALCWVISYFW